MESLRVVLLALLVVNTGDKRGKRVNKSGFEALEVDVGDGKVAVKVAPQSLVLVSAATETERVLLLGGKVVFRL